MEKRCEDALGATVGVTFEDTLDGALRSGSQDALQAAHIADVSNFEYADDFVLFEADSFRFADITRTLDETCKGLGAEISIAKTKWMYVSSNGSDDRVLLGFYIDQDLVERVHDFVYLGSLVAATHRLGFYEDVQR